MSSRKAATSARVAKPVVAAVDELVRRIEAMPAAPVEDASADVFDQQSVVADLTVCGEDPSADASDGACSHVIDLDNKSAIGFDPQLAWRR